MSTLRIAVLAPISAAVALAACASVPPPKEEVAAGRSAVEAAQLAGAAQYAAVELSQARSKLQQAEAAMRDERYVDARRFAEEATVDAELAQARAGSARAQIAAQQIDENLRALRSELNRAGAGGGPVTVNPIR